MNRQRKRRAKAALPAGVLALSLTGAACAESSTADAHSAVEQLRDVEVFDVTLASFQIFDREHAPQAPERLVKAPRLS
jgi:hypothetical protein